MLDQVRYVAVDWSGSMSSGGSEIWLAAVEEGVPVDIRGRLTRADAIAILCGWRSAAIPMMVGLDFAFSAPAWYVERAGCQSAAEFWAVAERDGENWLGQCPPPFWGRPGKPRGPAAQYRATELSVAGRPKSVFQVGGAGAVGTGSIRGMPYLTQLSECGFSVWPFDVPTPATVLEIYPRLLTGAGPKRQPGWRRAYLDAIGWPAGLAGRALVAATEDSFDAAVSAFRMWESRVGLARLEATKDSTELLEGRIWQPGAAIARVEVADWKPVTRPGLGGRSQTGGDSPVSRSVFRPERIIGQSAQAGGPELGPPANRARSPALR